MGSTKPVKAGQALLERGVWSRTGLWCKGAKVALTTEVVNGTSVNMTVDRRVCVPLKCNGLASCNRYRTIRPYMKANNYFEVSSFTSLLFSQIHVPQKKVLVRCLHWK